MIRAGDTIENPVTGERLVFRKTSRETGGQAVVIETFVAAERLRRGGARPPEPGGALRDPPRLARLQDRRQEARRRPGPAAHRPCRNGAQVLERRRRRGPLRLRDPPGAAVRVAARDDVRARGRRQDEPQGHAEPAAARRDRERALRHRPAAVPARDPPADRARARRTARRLCGYGPTYCPPAALPAAAVGLGPAVRRRLIIGALFTALLVLALARLRPAAAHARRSRLTRKREPADRRAPALRLSQRTETCTKP